MSNNIERDTLPENPSLEEIVRCEAKYLERLSEKHANEADKFRMEANRLKSFLSEANISL